VLIALGAFVVGIAGNVALRGGLGEQDFFGPPFYLLVWEYTVFHMAALSGAVILSRILSVRVCATLFLSLSVIGFLSSIYLLNPIKAGGIHFFMIFWGSLILIAWDYALRAKGRSQHEGIS
jgi:hypothetical protein